MQAKRNKYIEILIAEGFGTKEATIILDNLYAIADMTVSGFINKSSNNQSRDIDNG